MAYAYQVCDKWLKDRQGRQLAFADIQHYGNVVAALTRTRELMLAVDAVVDGALWPRASLSRTWAEGKLQRVIRNFESQPVSVEELTASDIQHAIDATRSH